jgi:4-amino-4-deoxy-L-arabinose transferase-like glycosyltransferase
MRKLILYIPIVVYVGMSAVMGFHSPGLQYDEALLVTGAVQMLRGPADPPIQREPSSAATINRQWLPVMVMPYLGAVKDYVTLPFFALFGVSTAVARVAAVLLGAIGIWGIASFVSQLWGDRAGLLTGLVLAIHPTYLDQTIYDNNGVALLMAATGLAAAALAGYVKHQTALRAALLGAAVGLLVYSRMNSAWLVAAALIACLSLYRTRCIPSLRNTLALVGGAIVGAAPLIWYELRSHWETIRFMRQIQGDATFGQALRYRFNLLLNTLISDAEHRAIWRGPDIPTWQLALIGLVVLFALLKGPRILSLTFALLWAMLVASRLPVAEHHIISLLPIAVVAVVVVFQRSKIGTAVAVIYVAIALYWDISFARGVRETEGGGAWSEAIYRAADYLQAHHLRQVEVLDWGLKTNLYVASQGTINGNERFWSTPQFEVLEPGVYLTNAPGNLKFPKVTERFAEALHRDKNVFQRISFNERNGLPCIEIYILNARR